MDKSRKYYEVDGETMTLTGLRFEAAWRATNDYDWEDLKLGIDVGVDAKDMEGKNYHFFISTEGIWDSIPDALTEQEKDAEFIYKITQKFFTIGSNCKHTARMPASN